MTLNLYVCYDDERVVNKTLTSIYTLNGTLRDECSVMSPNITIETTSVITQFNYAYIPEFNRYYYITNITAITDKLFELSLKCDVLMSFKNQLKNCYAVIERQETLNNNYIADNEYNKVEYETVGTFLFSNNYEFEPADKSIILTVAGKE